MHSVAAPEFLSWYAFQFCMISVGVAAVMSAALVLLGRPFLSLFTKDAAVAEAGLIRLRVMGCSYAFSALMDCTIAASRGLGKSFVPTVIVILGSCVFRVVWVLTVFARFHTLLSLYLLYIFSWTITGVAELFYFLRCWRERMGRMQGLPAPCAMPFAAHTPMRTPVKEPGPATTAKQST